MFKSKIIEFYKSLLNSLDSRCIQVDAKNLLAAEIISRLKILNQTFFFDNSEEELKKYEQIKDKIITQENLPRYFREFYAELEECLKKLSNTPYFNSLREEVASAQRNLQSDLNHTSGMAEETLTYYYQKIKSFMPKPEFKIESTKPTELKVTKIEVRPNKTNAKSRYEVSDTSPDPDIIKSSLFCKNKVLPVPDSNTANRKEEKKTYKKS